MLTKTEIARVDEIINTYQQFIITTHVNPDGDGLGSEVALAQYLRQKNKTVKILNSSPFPEMYNFLDPNQDVEIYEEKKHIEIVSNADAVFILDISDWERLRELGKFIKSSRLYKLCIDHHPAEKPFADDDIIYPKASSTGELIYDLLKGLDAKFNMRISEAIYTAILTDTGGFRFNNTTGRVHRIAAELLEKGIDPHKIYQQVYENQTRTRVKLMAEVLGSLQFAYDNQLAWMFITQQMLKDANATLKDTDGFSDFPRSIQGVEVALLFIELEDGRVKISFRSKGKIVINELAKYYSGGGHAFASGATVEGELPTTIDRVVKKAAALFEGFQ
jgi:phosphoesterase RecJ-like protein